MNNLYNNNHFVAKIEINFCLLMLIILIHFFFGLLRFVTLGIPIYPINFAFVEYVSFSVSRMRFFPSLLRPFVKVYHASSYYVFAVLVHQSFYAIFLNVFSFNVMQMLVLFVGRNDMLYILFFFHVFFSFLLPNVCAIFLPAFASPMSTLIVSLTPYIFSN